jgi:hypothetical protein
MEDDQKGFHRFYPNQEVASQHRTLAQKRAYGTPASKLQRARPNSTLKKSPIALRRAQDTTKYLNLRCAVPFVVSPSNHEQILSHDRKLSGGNRGIFAARGLGLGFTRLVPA